MTSKLNITDKEIERLAQSATDLTYWIGQKMTVLQTQAQKLPPELTTLGSLAVGVGLVVMLDNSIPEGGCWDYGNGSCVSSYWQ